MSKKGKNKWLDGLLGEGPGERGPIKVSGAGLVMGAGLGLVSYGFMKGWTGLFGAVVAGIGVWKKNSFATNAGAAMLLVTAGIGGGKVLAQSAGIQGPDEGMLEGAKEDIINSFKGAFTEVFLPFKKPTAAVHGLGETQYYDGSSSMGALTKADMAQLDKMERKIMEGGIEKGVRGLASPDEYEMSGSQEEIMGSDEYGMSGSEEEMMGADEWNMSGGEEEMQGPDEWNMSGAQDQFGEPGESYSE